MHVIFLCKQFESFIRKNQSIIHHVYTFHSHLPQAYVGWNKVLLKSVGVWLLTSEGQNFNHCSVSTVFVNLLLWLPSKKIFPSWSWWADDFEGLFHSNTHLHSFQYSSPAHWFHYAEIQSSLRSDPIFMSAPSSFPFSSLGDLMQ